MVLKPLKITYEVRDFNRHLRSPVAFQTEIYGIEFDVAYFSLTKEGLFTIKPLFPWDGASGPTIDDRDDGKSRTAVPTLFHDALYRAMRMGLIPLTYKPYADGLLYRMLVARDFEELRAKVWLEAVERFGGPSCVPGSDGDDVKGAT
jgi:hypothetical protein